MTMTFVAVLCCALPIESVHRMSKGSAFIVTSVVNTSLDQCPVPGSYFPFKGTWSSSSYKSWFTMGNQ